jgi:hypothetical protein
MAGSRATNNNYRGGLKEQGGSLLEARIEGNSG